MMRSINELANREGGAYVTVEESLSLAFVKDMELEGARDGMEWMGWDMGSGDISLFREIVVAAFHHACHGDAIGCCFSLSEAGTRQRRAQDVQEIEMAVFRCGGFVLVRV